MTALPRVRAGLLKHPLDKQVLVYDTRVDRVHLLDPTTACVLDLLEEGRWTVDGMTAEIAMRLDLAPNPSLVPLAFEELRASGLLDETASLPEPIDYDRRELLRTMAMTGAAALLIPTVATLTATRGYAQGTVTQGAGGGCTINAQCTSNTCCCGICSATGCPQANGAICNDNCQCSSGNCQNGICSAPLLPNGSACTASGQCANNRCCNGICRPANCTTSTSTGSCTGVNVPPGNAATGPEAICCSGTCQRQGNSSNFACTASTCT